MWWCGGLGEWVWVGLGLCGIEESRAEVCGEGGRGWTLFDAKEKRMDSMWYSTERRMDSI